MSRKRGNFGYRLVPADGYVACASRVLAGARAFVTRRGEHSSLESEGLELLLWCGNMGKAHQVFEDWQRLLDNWSVIGGVFI